MNTWKVILATMLIFGTGVVTGGLLVQHSGRTGGRRAPQHAPATHLTFSNSPAALSRFELMRRAERELDLTPAQREPIERILKDGQERMKKLSETIEPRRRQELRRTLEEFREVLTPAQRVRFDALLKQQQQRPRDQHKAGPPREASGTNAAPVVAMPGTNS